MDFATKNSRRVRVFESTRVRLSPDTVVVGLRLPNVAGLPTQTVYSKFSECLATNRKLIDPLLVLRNNILLQPDTVVSQRAF